MGRKVRDLEPGHHIMLGTEPGELKCWDAGDWHYWTVIANERVDEHTFHLVMMDPATDETFDHAVSGSIVVTEEPFTEKELMWTTAYGLANADAASTGHALKVESLDVRFQVTTNFSVKVENDQWGKALRVRRLNRAIRRQVRVQHSHMPSGPLYARKAREFAAPMMPRNTLKLWHVNERKYLR